MLKLKGEKELDLKHKGTDPISILILAEGTGPPHRALRNQTSKSPREVRIEVANATFKARVYNWQRPFKRSKSSSARAQKMAPTRSPLTPGASRRTA